MQKGVQAFWDAFEWKLDTFGRPKLWREITLLAYLNNVRRIERESIEEYKTNFNNIVLVLLKCSIWLFFLHYLRFF